MKKIVIPLTVCAFGFFTANATVIQAAVCDSLSDPQDILDCALINHPDIKLAEAALEQGRSLRSIARQRVNPGLDSKALFGKSSGENYSTAELNLAHTFELGNKRGVRVEQASAEQKILEANLAREKERVYIETFLSLMRLRQIESELETLREAVNTFTRIEKQYRSRQRLSPDQQVSLHIFSMAESAINLKTTLLQSEADAKQQEITLATGREFLPASTNLPPLKTRWPELTPSLSGQVLGGSLLRAAEADLELAKKQVAVARSQSRPDLRLGPSFEVTSQSSANESAIGANLGMGFPFYHRNQGGIAYAAQGQTSAELGLSIAQRISFAQRDLYLKRYERAVRSLTELSSDGDTEKQHQETNNLFNRGVISVSLLIESQRQRQEFVTSRNAQELSAIEALARIRALDNRLFEEPL